MPYLGKKPTDFADVTESQSFTVTDDLTVDTDTLYVDSANNRVGVGTTSPTRTFYVDGQIGASGRIHTANGSATDCALGIGDDNTGLFRPGTNIIGFSTNGSEVARFDPSGNFYVGTTDSFPAGSGENASGVVLGLSQSVFSKDGGAAVFINRGTSDGAMIQFRKGGSPVGEIGSTTSQAGQFFIAGALGTGLQLRSSDVLPTDSSGSYIDNAKDLGDQGVRWDDIYATNGTIQTSDANEKQQIASLSAAEITAAKAISKLFKTFKWNDSVAENGDNARTHTGVIAQDVQQAMTDAGLDAGDYAFFISTTWWENGGEIYDTQADAPAGATERTRLGIRYPELMAFVGAATEQRLADIETRLTALEATD